MIGRNAEENKSADRIVYHDFLYGQEKLVAGPQVSRKLADKLYLTGEGISPAGLVCVYKATARELIKENK